MAHTNDTVKHYLDHAGLSKLIELIKAADTKVATTAQTNLETLVGTIPADAEATDVIGYINEVVTAANGDITTLTTYVGMPKGGLAEGKPSVRERLETLEGDKDTEGSVAYQIAQVVADAPEAFDTLKEIAEWIQASADNEDGFDAAQRIVALEGLHAEDKTVAEEAQDAIDAIDEVSEDNGADDLVKVTVTTEAGSVKTVAVDDAALDTALEGITDRLDVIEGEDEGSIAKAVADEAKRVDDIIGDLPETVEVKPAQGEIEAEVKEISTVVEYVDAKVAAVNNGVASLNANKTSGEDVVSVNVVQTKGVITGLTVTTLIEPCGEDDVIALWGVDEETAEEPQA